MHVVRKHRPDPPRPAHPWRLWSLEVEYELHFWTHSYLAVRGATGSLQITIEHFPFNKIIQVRKGKHLKLLLLTLVPLRSLVSAGTTTGSWGADMWGLNPHVGSQPSTGVQLSAIMDNAKMERNSIWKLFFQFKPLVVLVKEIFSRTFLIQQILSWVRNYRKVRWKWYVPHGKWPLPSQQNLADAPGKVQSWCVTTSVSSIDVK